MQGLSAMNEKQLLGNVGRIYPCGHLTRTPTTVKSFTMEDVEETTTDLRAGKLARTSVSTGFRQSGMKKKDFIKTQKSMETQFYYFKNA